MNLLLRSNFREWDLAHKTGNDTNVSKTEYTSLLSGVPRHLVRHTLFLFRIYFQYLTNIPK